MQFRYIKQRIFEPLLIPIIAALSIGIIGWRADQLVERETRNILMKELNTVLRANVKALKIWTEAQKRNAESIAHEPLVRELVSNLIRHEQRRTRRRRDGDRDLELLRDYLYPKLRRMGYLGFSIINREGVFIGAGEDYFIGQKLVDFEIKRIQRIIDQEATDIRTPFIPHIGRAGNRKARAMVVGTPIRSIAGDIIAVIGLHIHPNDEFTRILSVARSGDSGETYAFNRDGLMISESRFRSELLAAGLLPKEHESSSVLNVAIRDPGGDLTKGFQTYVGRNAQPFTEMAAKAIAGESGMNVEGYRNYLGATVIGAWTWLHEYDFGVATETAVSEAYQPLYLLRRLFVILFALLITYAGVTLIFSLLTSTLRQRMLAAELGAKQLGQYALEHKIGEGGMGPVYHAQHSLLRRPTALKLLLPSKAQKKTIERFEQEVRLTCQLVHPNTIQIYDYGHTPEGIFYYAMEYLDGFNLKELVLIGGAQHPGRVIHIIRQVCASLSEAHELGLIHRDIKPSNIIISKRGNIYDFVKVLDFGLIKNIKSVDGQSSASDKEEIIVGTPQYLSPEAITDPSRVDARSDIYSIGATAYFLLTGRDVFEATTVIEICRHHLSTHPEPPSQRFDRGFDAGLEAVIMKCLAKNPNERFSTVGEIIERLEHLEKQCSWSKDEALRWWQQFRRKSAPADQKQQASRSSLIAKTLVVDIEERRLAADI